jgi:hypothetical protein
MEKAELDRLDEELDEMIRGRERMVKRWAERLSAEIIAAVAEGDDLPDEWYSVDAYADMGEPDAAWVAELVREELATTGIRP